jgi:hypothetical protein
MTRIARIALALWALAATLVAAPALADKVAVLPFLSASGATSTEIDASRAATKDASVALGHKLPTDPELLTAQMSSKDGVVDTGEEYRAAGKASTSDWTVVGHVEAHGGTYHLELDVCQVASGRIESLAREITPTAATTQIREMLALLVRPEGLANAAIPWERGSPVVASPPPEPAPTPPVAPPPPPPEPPPPPPPTIPAVKHAYAEGHPFTLGIGTGVLTAFERPSDATGSPTSALLGGTAGYAIDGLPGLELRADFDASVAGPKSITADVGARYAIPLVPTARVFFGPEVVVGGFFADGADKTPRALLRGAAFVAIGIGEHVQVDVAGNVAVAGGAPSLGLAGGTLRALYRF